MTRQNTKGQQQTSASAEHLDDARRAEAASAKPQSELEKLTSDIIVSLSGGAELPAAKLEDLQKRVEGISDSDRSKLQGSVSKGISHRLAALEVQSKASESQREVAPGEIEQIEKQYRAEADEVARSAVEGLLTESDASALMDALRKQYEKKIKRKGLLAMFKATDLNLRNAVIGILTATGVYKLLSVAQKELLDTYVGEDLEKHVKSLIQEHAEALGLKDVDVDIDDLAVMAMHAKEYMGDQKEQAGDLLHSALEKIPYIGDPRKFGILFDKCRFILLFRKASNSLEVPKRILWQISDMTYAELRDHVDGQDVEGDIYLGLSNVANMIADNRDFLQTELESAVHSLRENPEYKDLEDSDIIELLSEYTIENMTISDILLLKYGSDEERENWLPRSIGRLPALRRAWDLFRGKGYTHFRANMRYAADKLFGMRPGVLNADDLGRLNFTHASQTTQFEEVASEVNRLQDQIKKYTEQLQEQARKPGSFNAELWHERDRLMRKVDFLCDKRCGALFTETANSVLQRGQLVDMLASLTQKGGVSVSEVVAKMPNPSMAQEFIEQALKKGVTQITAAHVPALRAKYLENIVDFNRVKGVWEGAFDNCNRLLTREALPALADAEKAAKLLRRGSSSAAESVIGFRAKSITGKLKYAPKLLIPIGVIGAELYGVSQGNVRWEEFGWDIGEAGAGFVPILGTLLDFKAAIQGTSLSGRKMSTCRSYGA